MSVVYVILITCLIKSVIKKLNSSYKQSIFKHVFVEKESEKIQVGNLSNTMTASNEHNFTKILKNIVFHN